MHNIYCEISLCNNSRDCHYYFYHYLLILLVTYKKFPLVHFFPHKTNFKQL